MRRVTLLAATALAAGLFAAISPAIAQETGEGDAITVQPLDGDKALELVTSAIDGAIRPGYQAFDDAAREEALKVETLCSDPNEETLQDAQEGFGDLAEAFAGIEFVRFGPIRDENRLERILFFPDPRGVTRRQVEQLLAGGEDSALNTETLAQKSVAVQGLPALEFVLFGDGSETLGGQNGAYRCAYGKAITQNLATIASHLDAAWADDTGIYRRLTSPGADDPAYRTPADSVGAITKIFTEGLEIIRDQRIEPALGEDGKPPKPNLFLFNRSNSALTALKADFTGLKTLFDAAGFEQILPGSQAYLTDSIGLEFDQIGKTLSDLSTPLSEAAGEAAWRGKLDYVMIASGSIRSQFEGQLAPALGLSSGFSSLDGD